MSGSVYVFGSFGSGYTQYPGDYAREIFREFCKRATAKSQLVIHRDGSLMYYGYIRRLAAEGQYIGFCVLLNGVMLLRVKRLFSVFESIVTDLAAKGVVLERNEAGGIVPCVGDLGFEPQEVERVAAILGNMDWEGELRLKKLPPVSYGREKGSTERFYVDDMADDMAKASAEYDYTCVFKEKSVDIPCIPSSDRNELMLKSELQKLRADYVQLRGKYDSLRVEFAVVQDELKRLRADKAKSADQMKPAVRPAGGFAGSPRPRSHREVCVFGNLGSGYSQYPHYPDNCGMDRVSRKFLTLATCKTQMIIHQEDRKMYYGYVRKLAAGKYLGFCLRMDGAAVSEVKRLFSIFENTFKDWSSMCGEVASASLGDIIKYNPDMSERAIAAINNAVANELSDSLVPLSGDDSGSHSIGRFLMRQEDAVIVAAVSKYGYVVVEGEKEFTVSQGEPIVKEPVENKPQGGDGADGCSKGCTIVVLVVLSLMFAIAIIMNALRSL